MSRRFFLVALLAAVAALVVARCQRSSPPGASPPAENAAETIHVRRLHDTEEVLAQLHRKAWVFKHQGGDVTSEFTIYHRPEGKDQQERAIYTASGDDAIHFRRALQQTSEPDGRPQDDGAVAPADRPQPPDGTPGYDDALVPADRPQPREAREDEGDLIVVVPTFQDLLTGGSGEIMYKFNLAGGAGVMSTTTAETVYPKTVFSHSRVGSSSGAVKKPIELTPGETKVLVDLTERFRSRGRDTPFQEEETLRYVVTITALKDGQLPKRGGESQPK